MYQFCALNVLFSTNRLVFHFKLKVQIHENHLISQVLIVSAKKRTFWPSENNRITATGDILMDFMRSLGTNFTFINSPGLGIFPQHWNPLICIFSNFFLFIFLCFLPFHCSNTWTISHDMVPWRRDWKLSHANYTVSRVCVCFHIVKMREISFYVNWSEGDEEIACEHCICDRSPFRNNRIPVQWKLKQAKLL